MGTVRRRRLMRRLYGTSVRFKKICNSAILVTGLLHLLNERVKERSQLHVSAASVQKCKPMERVCTTLVPTHNGETPLWVGSCRTLNDRYREISSSPASVHFWPDCGHPTAGRIRAAPDLKRRARLVCSTAGELVPDLSYWTFELSVVVVTMRNRDPCMDCESFGRD